MVSEKCLGGNYFVQLKNLEELFAMFNLTSKSSFHTQRILIFMIQYVVKWSQINSKEKLSKFQNLCQILLTLCQSMSIQQSIIGHTHL